MKLKKWWVVSLVAIVSVMLLMWVVNDTVALLTTYEDWTIDHINQSLDAQIPIDAYEVTYSGRWGLGGSLQLSFKAPTLSADSFLKHICDGILYKGYDPFNAIDIAEPYTYTVPITLGLNSYSSYSPKTPPTVVGNRCLSKHQYQLRVEDVDSQTKSVKLDAQFSCTLCKPLYIREINFPFSDFPLMVVGLKKADTGYSLTGKEICIAVKRYGYPDSKSDWTWLIGAKIQINVDDKKIAAVSASEKVTPNVNPFPSRSIALQFINSPQKPPDGFYCFEMSASTQDRDVTVIVTTTSGETSTYSWQLITDTLTF